MKSQSTEDFFTKVINQLDDNIYYLYAKHCSRNILDIILDYPDSEDVIGSLRKCLKKASLVYLLLCSSMKSGSIWVSRSRDVYWYLALSLAIFWINTLICWKFFKLLTPRASYLKRLLFLSKTTFLRETIPWDALYLI